MEYESNRVPVSYEPLWEARQEAEDNGTASPPTNWLARMAQRFGKATGLIDENQTIF